MALHKHRINTHNIIGRNDIMCISIKKLTASFMALAMMTSALAGCSRGQNSSSDNSGAASGSSETVKLTVWGAQEDQDVLKQMCEDFAKAHSDKHYAFTLGVVSEADAANEVLKDVSAAADVFSFASDQIGSLVSAGALYRITKNREEIENACTETAVRAATVDGELYGYPAVSDTYFLYYDKSKLSDEDVKSLDTIMAKDIPDTKINLAMNLDDGWYQAGFFLGAGCTLFGEDGTDPTQCDFNNERGLLAGEYILSLAKSAKFGADYDDSMVRSGFANGTIAAAISGTWNSKEIESSLRENYGTAKLPEFTLSNGESVQMGSLANYKLIGVSSETDAPLDAMLLAEWLTNYDNQKLRLEKRSFAPVNKTLAEDSGTLSEIPAVSALTEQLSYATLQPSIPQMGSFWKPSEAFGQDVISGAVTTDNLQEKLDRLVQSTLSNITEE